MSNKTPSEQPNETASAPKSNRSILLIILVVIISLIFIARVFIGINYGSKNGYSLQTPNGSINLDIVDTPDLRQLGLSGRSSISENYGLMFVFEEISENNCFWMKDMKFSIDMVWLNERREVVTVTPNVTPESYPETFCPDKPAKYGLELRDGNADNLEIVEGSKLRW